MEELDKITTQRAIRGDKKAFKALYDFYAPYIWRVLIKMSTDEQTARELLQDTFIRVHKSLKKFKSESALSTWIYRIAFNAGMLHFKKQKNLKRYDSYQDTMPGKQNNSYETREIIEKIMSEMTEQERFLLTAKEIDGISFEELAEITGMTSGALRTRLHRLKEKIRNRFSEKETREVYV